MKTNIAKTLIESFGLVQEAADPVKVNRFIQLVNSGKMSGELIQLQRELRPEMFSSDALSQAFTKMNGMMIDKIGANKNPQAKTAPVKPTATKPAQRPVPGKPAAQPVKTGGAAQAKIAAQPVKAAQPKPTAQPVKSVQPGLPGGATQAKPAAPAYDDMPPIAQQTTQPLSPESQTSDIMQSLKKLSPDQIAHLHNSLKDQHQNKSFLGRATNVSNPSWIDGGTMNKADGTITPELQQLINHNKKDSISYIKDMIRLNQKKA